MVESYFVCRRFVTTTRYDKCNCSVVNLIPFFEYEIDTPSLLSDLVSLVFRNDLNEVKEFIKVNNKMRIVDKHGNGLLHLAVIFKKLDLFDYLLTTDIINVNALNRYGHTCLHLGIINNCEHVVMKLIQRNADVNITDETGCSPLHTAASQYTSDMCKIILHHGGDIDFQNLSGKTALYHACQYGTIETVHMLLYYGANATIPDRHGILPLTVAMQQSLNCDEIPQSYHDIHQVLYNYTFEKKKIDINLTTLTVAMKLNSPLFPEMLKKIDEVSYGRNDLMELSQSAIFIKPQYFKIFMRKFDYVIRAMLCMPNDLHHKISNHQNCDEVVEKLMNFLTMIFEYRRNLNFLKENTTFRQFIGTLCTLYKASKITLKTFTSCVLFLYSYGLSCEISDIILIYESCGFSELLRSILEVVHVNINEQRRTVIMPYLICDVHLSVSRFLRYGSVSQQPRKHFQEALSFFSRSKVKNFFARDPEFDWILRQAPEVPSLVELSRDVARKHIIKKFKIKKTRDFYILIRRLPVSEIYKKILIYQKPIYHFVHQR